MRGSYSAVRWSFLTFIYFTGGSMFCCWLLARFFDNSQFGWWWHGCHAAVGDVIQYGIKRLFAIDGCLRRDEVFIAVELLRSGKCRVVSHINIGEGTITRLQLNDVVHLRCCDQVVMTDYQIDTTTT